MQFHRSFDRFPGRMPSLHVAGIESGVAQRLGGFATDVEAVDAEDDHGLRLGQVAHPVAAASGIAPEGGVHDFLAAPFEELGAGEGALDRVPPVETLPSPSCRD